MRLAAQVVLLIGILLALVAATRADTIVKDGDDIIIDGRDYRFVTVDAFEPGQTCKDSQGLEYDCGARAKDTLEKIIGGEPVCLICDLEAAQRVCAACRLARHLGLPSKCPITKLPNARFVSS